MSKRTSQGNERPEGSSVSSERSRKRTSQTIRDARNFLQREGGNPLAAVFYVSSDDVADYMKAVDVLDVVTKLEHGKTFEEFSKDTTQEQQHELMGLGVNHAVGLEQGQGREIAL